MGAAISEVRAKSVASYVFHFVFVWERGHGTLRVFPAKVFVKEDEVCEASANFDHGLLKGCKVCL